MNNPTPLFIILCLYFLNSCIGTRTLQNLQIDYINQLKDGFLLVRLHSVENKIIALQARGQRSEANRTKVAQKMENARIVKAFHEHFDFCPVYFFYSKESKKIKDNQLDGVVLNRQFLPVAQEQIAEKQFLIADFARIQPPADGAGLPALIVLNQQLIQLSKPFPFYIRTTMLGETDMEVNAVKELNQNLQDFWQESLNKSTGN